METGVSRPSRIRSTIPLLDLAVAHQGYLGKLEPEFRHVVARKSLRGEVIKDTLRRNGLSAPEHHGEADALAQPVVGDGYCRGPLDTGVAHRELFDPRRVDIVAAADDDLLLAPGEAEISVLVDPAHVAGHEPAVVVETRFGGELVVEIAEHQACAASGEQPDLARRQAYRRVFLFEDRDVVTRARLAGRRHDQFRIVVGHGVLVAVGLRHAVAALRHDSAGHQPGQDMAGDRGA